MLKTKGLARPVHGQSVDSVDWMDGAGERAAITLSGKIQVLLNIYDAIYKISCPSHCETDFTNPNRHQRGAAGGTGPGHESHEKNASRPRTPERILLTT